jgi:hypothetical protein
MSKLFNQQVKISRESLIDQANRLRHLASKMRSPEIKQAWDLFPLNLRKEILIFPDTYDNGVCLSLYLNDLDGFKDPRLLKVLEKFADGSWEANTVDWTGNNPNRVFKFKRGYVGFTVHIRIDSTVRSDSPTCKVVVKEVRTRVVTEEIKEIVCV